MQIIRGLVIRISVSEKHCLNVACYGLLQYVYPTLDKLMRIYDGEDWDPDPKISLVTSKHVRWQYKKGVYSCILINPADFNDAEGVELLVIHFSSFLSIKNNLCYIYGLKTV